MILNSREIYLSSEEFRDKFIETLTPGVIHRNDFIQWKSIFNKVRLVNPLLDFFRQINGRSDEDRAIQIVGGLLSADNPLEIIEASFELLGHTNKKYVSNIDNVNLGLLEGDLSEDYLKYMAELLVDLGICNIISLELEDYFTGVQVGLESNRRKNVGGEAFSSLIKEELSIIVESLRNNGHEIVLEEQRKIYFADGVTSKTVDFCLTYEGKIIGIEVNFYTASGSKPAEIKRSYGHISAELERVGASLVWITDGIGYESMKKSLKEARDIHKNIYNFSMVKDFFKKDIIELFRLN